MRSSYRNCAIILKKTLNDLRQQKLSIPLLDIIRERVENDLNRVEKSERILVTKFIYNELKNFGPLEDLLLDKSVQLIEVERYNLIRVNGRRAPTAFISPQSMRTWIKRFLAGQAQSDRRSAAFEFAKNDVKFRAKYLPSQARGYRLTIERV